MNKIPTAEELAIKMFVKHPDAYSSFNRVSFTGKQLKEVAIALSNLHVEAALEEASKKVKTKVIDTGIGEFEEIDKESILSAYPLTNIK